MRRIGVVATVFVLSFSTSACVRVPEVNGTADVPLNEVVKRVKCDLVKAVQAKALENPRLFSFLTQWSAKVHLTLVVDNTATINPGVTLINPLIPSGTNFSLALGAGLTTEAVRTEDFEFFLYFPTVISEFSSAKNRKNKYNDCRFEEGVLLESDLDLKSVFDKALGPVRDGTLYRGANVGFGSGAPPVIPAGEAKAIQESLEKLKPIRFTPSLPDEVLETFRLRPEFGPLLDDLKKNVPRDANQMAANIVDARQVETDSQSVIKNIVTPLYDIAAASLPKTCAPKIADEKFKAVTFSSIVSLRKIDVDRAKTLSDSNAALTKEKDALDKSIESAKQMVALIEACQVAEKKEKGKANEYDPIELIGETINFYITTSGSITPSWKLVRVTAPLSPTFVSASRKDTNTLIVALGRPELKATGQVGASSAMDAQVLRSILSQALSGRAIVP
jgi:hypothetical protein